jgi:L-ascorbate metabolism protein UlaG (beta-lactamase superfamily)
MGVSGPKEDLYWLSESAIFEPLINKWVAWPDMIAPATYSLHMKQYQIDMLSSYLSDPDIHFQTRQNPQFLTGPFINVPPERAGEVRELLNTTIRTQADNLELARAMVEFQEYLSKEAAGQSLESYYSKAPEALRGYIELLYDYYNHPIVRFIESLLYESPYYKKSLQTLRLLRHTRDESRPYFLNTPRLPGDNQLDWSVTFDAQELDEFFKLEFTPQPLGYLRELIGLRSEDEARLLPLLTRNKPQPIQQNNAGIRLRYFGHACVLVEWQGISVLTDPFIGAIPAKGGIPRWSYKDLPEKIDFVLITHAHHDHFVLETLLRLRNRIGCLVVPRSFGIFYADVSLKLVAQMIGFKNIVEMDTLDSIKLPEGSITAVPFFGEHADLPHAKTGYILQAGSERILFAADSNCLDKRMYEHLRRIVGPVETVFLGMECVGAPLSFMYGALMPIRLQYSDDQSRRTRGCDSTSALELLDGVGAKRVYIYAMGCEPWLSYSLGLNLSERSVQIKESDKVIMKAREKGLTDASRPFGQFELYLSSSI